MSTVEKKQSVQRPQRWGLAVITAVGLSVAAILAAYARIHPGNGAAFLTFGFSGILQMKAWLTTAAASLVIVQVGTALAMWGRLPFVSRVPSWTAVVHRTSGTVAFVLTLPVAFQCVWSLGFSTTSTRTVIHSIAGCLFYGAFAAKMLALRLPRLPGPVLPILGGLVAGLLTVIWFSAAFWFFTQSGFARY
ncbi:DUF6529 family protein [Pengzhenrongella sp.]|uniref:DUF6529 family protein n=1 Tax=Pengzhenrongella sp. TaxID=2888820 RepID=UPI002F954B1D